MESQRSIGWRHAGPRSRTAAFQLRSLEGYGSMMQDVQATTADSYLQVDNDSAFVAGCTTCWKPATVGRDCHTVLKRPVRMCRG